MCNDRQADREIRRDRATLEAHFKNNEPCQELKSPLLEWAVAVSHDEWMSRHLTALDRSLNLRLVLEGGGTYYRLCRHPPGVTTQDVVERLFAGVPEEWLIKPLLWLREVHKTHRQEIEGAAAQAAESAAMWLSGDLDYLLDELDAGNKIDPDAVWRLALSRDDYESIRVFLKEIELHKRLEDVLSVVDSKATRLFEFVPPGTVKPSEQLQRARELMMDDSWWVTIGA